MRKTLQDNSRNANLDALRVASLLAIVLYHVLQRWPSQLPPSIITISSFGQYGVDIFFALSGWLVGSKLSTPEPTRTPSETFAKRLARIYPTYLAALIIAYTGVAIAREQEFASAYLFLAQNYLITIPFFLVSWFLCVIVQFYMVTYILQALFGKNRRLMLLASLFILAAFSASRIALIASESIDAQIPFGYYYTAFHLRGDSILAAFCAGIAFPANPDMLQNRKFRFRLSGMAVCWLLTTSAWAILVTTKESHFQLYYVLNPILLAIICTSLVAFLSMLPTIKEANYPLILKGLVASLFSIYLTHSFAIEAAERISQNHLNDYTFAAIVFALIVSIAWAFYAIIERPLSAFALNLPKKLE
jgi:peptidoglycan/LPS O-acetylase OafA/YrhL